MATEEKVSQTEEQNLENDYRETLLVRNPETGKVDAVSKLVTNGNRREVHTTQPTSKNSPGFFEFKDSNAVAAFIRGFKSQKDNPISFQFLKVPRKDVPVAVTALEKLSTDPNNEEGLAAYRQYVVNTAKLEKIKFDNVDIPRKELLELAIDFDKLPEHTRNNLMSGLPTKDLFPASIQISKNGTTAGYYNLSFYRDHNDRIKYNLETPLPSPEFNNEQYRTVFSTTEKTRMAKGGTVDRLINMANPVTGKIEPCHVALNPVTNRLISIPHREVEVPTFHEGVFIDDAKKEVLNLGGRVDMEGCHSYNSPEDTYHGTLCYDVFKGEYAINTPYFDKPFIPKNLREQLSEDEIKRVIKGERVPADHVKDRKGAFQTGKVVYLHKERNQAFIGKAYTKKAEEERSSDPAVRESDTTQQSRGRKR